jgi:hypothetical protein
MAVARWQGQAENRALTLRLRHFCIATEIRKGNRRVIRRVDRCC